MLTTLTRFEILRMFETVSEARSRHQGVCPQDTCEHATKISRPYNQGTRCNSMIKRTTLHLACHRSRTLTNMTRAPLVSSPPDGRNVCRAGNLAGSLAQTPRSWMLATLILVCTSSNGRSWRRGLQGAADNEERRCAPMTLGAEKLVHRGRGVAQPQLRGSASAACWAVNGR